MNKEMYTPPQIKIVEFGEDDVVVCSGSITPDPDTTTDEQW